MRQIILDTETTGLDPEDGHRVVEIACIELENCVPTNRMFHRYVNPERSMPRDAQQIHGLTEAFLADKPKFAEVVDELLAFIGDAPLVIHNARFDIAFLNEELKRLGRSCLMVDTAIDTVELARRKFPGAPASLDALCRRFGIDNGARVKHGALLDAELLAEVYLELIGGRQPGLELLAGAAPADTPVRPQVQLRKPRPHAPTLEEQAAHAAFLESIENPVWNS